jgi:hypothetical protein
VHPWTRTFNASRPTPLPSPARTRPAGHGPDRPYRSPKPAVLPTSHVWDGLRERNGSARLRPGCLLSRAAHEPTMDHGTQTTAAWPARLDNGHPGIRLIPTQAKASTPGHPTGRDDSPAGGVPRKLAGLSPGVATRHPSGTLLCLHVSKPGSDGVGRTGVDSPPPLGRHQK